MIDATTRSPLRVFDEGSAGPYILAPFSQLAEIQRVLDANGIEYSVDEEAISFDGGPETVGVDFGRGADAFAIQAILDSALNKIKVRMALHDEIAKLRDRGLQDLYACHNYYADTTIAWRIVRKAFRAGHTFTVRRHVTGHSIPAEEFAQKSREYIAGYLAESTFQQFISILEDFVFDLLRLWLASFPQSLSGRQIEFKVILEAPDKDAITSHVIENELNAIAYQRPREWFAYLDARVKLGCPSSSEVDQFAEAKATRDVLAHNRGIANRIYELKAGRTARHAIGERVSITDGYHRQTWELIRKMVADISDAAIMKSQ